jgi:protocatechuate 3,4-dioxygenase beta subunit
VTGELIRSDITDGQPGVPLYLDMQMINTKTCEPVPDIYMDFWHCNSTVRFLAGWER